MKRTMIILSFGLLILVGCTTPQRYVVDVNKVAGCEGFDWDGRVTVTMTYKGLLGGTTVDLIKLRSRNARSLLLETTGGRVRAYAEVEVERLENRRDQANSAEAGESETP